MTSPLKLTRHGADPCPMKTLRAAAVLTVLLVVAGCSAPEPTPDELVDAWAQASCQGANPKVFWGGPEGDGADGVVVQAVCDLDDNTVAGRRQWFAVYDTPEALATKVAVEGCSETSLRVTGENWYASTQQADAATALQRDMDGELYCG